MFLAWSGTSKPFKISLSTKRTVLFPIGSIMKLCSPLNSTGRITWYFQLNSLFSTTLTTAQCNVMSCVSVLTFTSTSSSTFSFPIACWMKGFHSGYLSRPTTLCQVWHWFRSRSEALSCLLLLYSNRTIKILNLPMNCQVFTHLDKIPYANTSGIQHL